VSHKTLTIKRIFAAPIEQVYAAWTEPAHFAQWYGGKDATVPLETLSMDVRKGGKWHAVMHLPNDLTMDWSGEYTEVDPPTRLAFTMTDDPTTSAVEPIMLEFAAVDSGTEMTLVQHGTEDFSEEMYQMTIAGYGQYFDALEKSLRA
jgi:uncharacterized protein YndB with AHSA1/START domain